MEWVSLSFLVLALVFFREEEFWAYTRFDYHTVQSVLYGILYYVISAVGVVFLLTIARWLSQCTMGRVCAGIGTYSMDIYVIHMFLIKFIPIPINFETTGKMAAYFILAIAAMAILLLVWVISKWVLRRFRCYRIVVGAT